MSSERLPNDPKSPPKNSNLTSKGPQNESNVIPKLLQNEPNMIPNVSKVTENWSQNGPKVTQKIPKITPKRAKTTPKRLEIDPKSAQKMNLKETGKERLNMKKSSVSAAVGWASHSQWNTPSDLFQTELNGLAQQMEPKRHKRNTRTYHRLPERPRNTPNRPWTCW